MINRATLLCILKSKQDLYDHILNVYAIMLYAVLDPDQIVQGNRLKVLKLK